MSLRKSKPNMQNYYFTGKWKARNPGNAEWLESCFTLIAREVVEYENQRLISTQELCMQHLHTPLIYTSNSREQPAARREIAAISNYVNTA